jgi:hypothetical protein
MITGVEAALLINSFKNHADAQLKGRTPVLSA